MLLLSNRDVTINQIMCHYRVLRNLWHEGSGREADTARGEAQYAHHLLHISNAAYIFIT